MWRLRFRNIKNKNENLFHIYVSCDNCGLAAAMFQGELSEQETAEGKKNATWLFFHPTSPGMFPRLWVRHPFSSISPD